MVILYDICKYIILMYPSIGNTSKPKDFGHTYRASLFKTMHHLVFSIPKKSDEMDV